MDGVPEAPKQHKKRHFKRYLALFILIVIIAGFFLFFYPSTSLHLTLLGITDPTSVPAGTTALTISYSSAQVQVANGNSSGFVSVSSTGGSINLLSLSNVSQIIGGVLTGPGAIINGIKLVVSSASLTINGTTYPVSLPNDTVFVHVTGRKINATASILLDFTPNIISISNGNSTSFMLVPSVRASFTPSGINLATGINVAKLGISIAASKLGAGVTVSKLGILPTTALSAGERQTLDGLRPSISLSNAVVKVNGNYTNISVTVTDTSNQSTYLRQLFLSGPETVTSYNGNKSLVVINGTRMQTYCANADRFAPGPVRAGPAGSNYSILNISSIIPKLSNSSVLTGLNDTLVNLRNMFLRQTYAACYGLMGTHFLIFSNGTLLPPTSLVQFNDVFGHVGYLLSAGKSVTLNFDGVIKMGNSSLISTVDAGSQYLISVFGDAGARAFANVTAQS